MSDCAQYVPVTRETIWTGVLPWAGAEYEDRIQGLIRKSPYDPLVFLVREDVMDVYRQHAPVNSHLTKAEARVLGIEAGASNGSTSFMTKLKRALGNPDA